MKKINKRLKELKEDSKGFTLLDGVLASSIVLVLATGTGVLTYSTIQDNQNRDAVEIAAQTAYNEALSSLTDFDKKTTVAKTIDSLNKSYKSEKSEKSIIFEDSRKNKDSQDKNTLCITASMNEGKYSSTVGPCGDESAPPVIDNPNPILDTFSTVNYNCSVDTTGNLPFRLRLSTDKHKNVIIKGSDGSSYTTPSNGEVTFKAGVDYTVKNNNSYENFKHDDYQEDLAGNKIPALRDCVTSIDSFGKDSGVSSLILIGGEKLTDVPDTIPTTVRNFNMIFKDATKINDPDISEWNTANVTSMQNSFNNASSFNQSLSKWKVNNVSNISYMFQKASNFNQPLNTWNFNDLKEIRYAFSGATNFNQSVNHWNTENITNFSGVFQSAVNFNKPLDNWKVNQAKNFSYLFNNAQKFNQPLSSWKVTSELNYLTSTFFNAKAFNQNINHWDTSGVTSFTTTFGQAYKFNQPLNNWKLDSAERVNGMFKDAWEFNQPIDSWKFPNVTSLSEMFNQAKNFNQDISSWDTGGITNFTKTFYRAYSFDQPVGKWNVSKVTDYTQMFEFAFNFNQNLDGWSLNQDYVPGIDMNRIFRGALSFNNGDSHKASSKPLQWNTSNVSSLRSIFNGSIDSSSGIHDAPKKWLPEGTSLSASFNQPINDWNTLKNTNLEYAFYKSSFNQPLNNWNTSNVTTMLRTFQGPGDSELDTEGSRLIFNQPLNNWDTSKVTNMYEMFRDAHYFNQPLNKWDTSKVTDMTRMFYDSKRFNQNISEWNLNNLKTYPDVFGGESIITSANKPSKLR